MISLGYEREAVALVADRTGMTVDQLEPCTGVALTYGGKIAGGFAFRNYRGHDVEINLAIDDPRAFSRSVPRMVFGYIFDQLGCARCTALVRRGNKRSRRLIEGMGFVLEGKARRGYDGKQDMMIYGMLKEECRWLK